MSRRLNGGIVKETVSRQLDANLRRALNIIRGAAILQIGLNVVENNVGAIVPLGNFVAFGTLRAVPGESHGFQLLLYLDLRNMMRGRKTELTLYTVLQDVRKRLWPVAVWPKLEHH